MAEGDEPKSVCRFATSAQPQGEKQLDRLLSYTTFHIGLYSAIFAVAVGYLRPKVGETPVWVLVPLGIGCVLLITAGAAGGVIAGHLAHFSDYKTFIVTRFRPRLLKRLLGDGWAYDRWSAIEHTSFWLGVVAVVTAVAASLWFKP